MSEPTVLITGGSGGIGFELAKLFAADGYRTVLVARRKAELERAAEELRSTSPIDVVTIEADLSDPAAPKRLIGALSKRQITVDVLVNNAGFGLLGSFAATNLDRELAMVQVNVTALTELTKRLLPGMLERGSGRILNVASVAAFVPGPFMAVYYASKAFVLSFSEALHEELRGTGVTVTTLCPGPVATGFQSRAEIANVRLFSGNVMTAEAVAEAGYRALVRGQRLAIPGVSNWLRVVLTRFAPRGLVLRAVRRIHA